MIQLEINFMDEVQKQGSLKNCVKKSGELKTICKKWLIFFIYLFTYGQGCNQ